MLRNALFLVALGAVLGGVLSGGLVSSSLMSAECVKSPNALITGEEKQDHKTRTAEGQCKSGLKIALDWFFHDATGIATVLLVIITGGLVFVTGRLVAGGDAQLAHNRQVERAYIEISHKTPPALDIRVSEGLAVVQMEIRNTGSTPAKVTNAIFSIKGVTPPNSPDIPVPKDYKAVKAFLVTNGHVVSVARWSRPPPIMQAIKDEKIPCWIYGYVDYIDIFGIRHRAGYLRKFDRWDNSLPPVNGQPAERANNLIFDDLPDFNYDRLRIPGEGNDWGEA